MKESLYLETSVPSAYYDYRELERRNQTRKFWDELENYDIYISTLVITELKRIKNEERKRLTISLVKDFERLEITEECQRLMEIYENARIVPRKYKRDILHLSIASANTMDNFVSWNYRHIVRKKTKQKVNELNTLNSYKTINIVSPLELLGDHYEL